MKKIELGQGKLSLNKQTISNLSRDGGANRINWTGGCTDGCGGSASFASMWNCTNQGCTADCEFGINSACVCKAK